MASSQAKSTSTRKIINIFNYDELRKTFFGFFLGGGCIGNEGIFVIIFIRALGMKEYFFAELRINE